MRELGAFNEFLTPSVDLLALLSGGDVEDDVLGGRVLIRRGTKALRASSVGESLLDVLPPGDDLDGLFRMPAVVAVVDTVVIVVVPAVSAAYSEYLMGSNVYGEKTGGKLGLNRSAGGGIGIAPLSRAGCGMCQVCPRYAVSSQGLSKPPKPGNPGIY